MKTHPTLLLVDDDPEIRDQMKWALSSDYELLEAADRPSALTHVRQRMPPLVLLDLGLPPDSDGASEGLAILRETMDLNPMAKVIVVTGNSDRVKAIAAIESGGYDFIEKPVQLDVLRIILQRATYLFNLEQENRELQQQAGLHDFEGLIGTSAQMLEVFRERSTTRAREAKGRLSRSTVAPFQRHCWRVNFLAMKKEPSPEPCSNEKGASKVRGAARCF
jgi:two-component system NtrC family response regulator